VIRLHEVSTRSLSKTAWRSALTRTVKKFSADNLSDRAAALTYFGVLSIFPGLLVLVSTLRLFGRNTAQTVVNNVSGLAPGQAGDTIDNAVKNLSNASQGGAVALVVISLLGSLWSASGYVSAFMRVANDIYDVPEGRPFLAKLPVRLGLTVFAGVLLVVATFMVVFTGDAARNIGSALGLGSSVTKVWDIAKWPVLLIIVSLLFAVFYWAAPNANVGRFRWITAGGLVAVVIWLLASAGFAFYVANFGSYNKVYGSIASIIVFLIWLWISNMAILVGAEFDAQLVRERAIAGGAATDADRYVSLRDTRKLPKPV
jgi:membrane protein